MRPPRHLRTGMIREGELSMKFTALALVWIAGTHVGSCGGPAVQGAQGPDGEKVTPWPSSPMTVYVATANISVNYPHVRPIEMSPATFPSLKCQWSEDFGRAAWHTCVDDDGTHRGSRDLNVVIYVALPEGYDHCVVVRPSPGMPFGSKVIGVVQGRGPFIAQEEELSQVACPDHNAIGPSGNGSGRGGAIVWISVCLNGKDYRHLSQGSLVFLRRLVILPQGIREVSADSLAMAHSYLVGCEPSGIDWTVVRRPSWMR